MPFTGARAKAWCLLIHAEAPLSLRLSFVSRNEGTNALDDEAEEEEEDTEAEEEEKEEEEEEEEEAEEEDIERQVERRTRRRRRRRRRRFNVELFACPQYPPCLGRGRR